MNILFATSECAPFIKTGGLADVAGALPKALAGNGHDVRVILPLYEGIGEEWRSQMTYLQCFHITLAWRSPYCGIFELKRDGVTYWFVDNEYYFKRSNIYGHYDDGERFAYFSRAVVESMGWLNWHPDVLHCNDWQTALVPIYLVSPLLKKMTDGLSEAHWNYLVGLWLIATIGMDTLCDLAPAGPWQSALTVHWTLNLDFVAAIWATFLLGARLARLQKLPRRGTLWGVTAASFARHRRRHLLAHQPHRRLRRAHQELSASLYRRAGRGPVPAGALLWGGPEQRAGPHRPVRAVLRRLPGTPHGHPVLAEGVDGLDHPRGGHHPPPARLLSGHPAQLPGGRGPAHVRQAPVLALYRPELFLCLPGVQPVRPVPAEPFQANPGVLIMHSKAAHEAALLLNLFYCFS